MTWDSRAFPFWPDNFKLRWLGKYWNQTNLRPPFYSPSPHFLRCLIVLITVPGQSPDPANTVTMAGASARTPLALASLILILGALLLMLLTILGGSVGKNPTNRFYYLEADTSNIPGAAQLTRWTTWNACGVTNGRNMCPSVHPAYAFDPPRNFGSSEGVPTQFIGTHKYYYLTRFMFAFHLIALFFGVCALFTGLLALCSRIGSFLSSLPCSIALFFQTLTAALMTAAYVLGRNNFRSAGRTASLGRYNFGFMWAAVACLFISTILLCAGGAASGNKNSTYSSRGTGGRSFMGRRKKSNRSRGSFIDKERERRISKDSD